MRQEKGFTLLEMLISVTIISVLVGVSVPIYESFVRQNDLNLTEYAIVNMLRRAESYARANNTDNVWSVEIQSTAATLFQGTSFASRNTNYDETYTFPSSVTPSGITEVQFAKMTALPNTTGTITLTSTTSDAQVITINAKGMVDF